MVFPIQEQYCCINYLFLFVFISTIEIDVLVCFFSLVATIKGALTIVTVSFLASLDSSRDVSQKDIV